MTNPKCAACGHVNRVGAAVCEMCDTRLGDPAGAETAEPFSAAEETSDDYSGGFGARGEGFDPAGGGARAGGLPTDIPSPQFKGVGDVISPTLEVYRKHFTLVGLLVLTTTLPLAVLQYAAASAVISGSFEGGGIGGPSGGGMAVSGGGALLYWLLSMLGSALLSGALAYAVVEIQRTGAAAAGASLRWGLGKMLKIFAVLIVGTLLYIGPFVLLGLLAFLLSLALGPAAFPLALIGFLALLLPWVVMMLMFSLAVPAAAIENRGVIESLSRSAELTKGFKGLLFLTYFLWWLVIIVLTLVVTWSFAYDGEASLMALVVQTVVGGMLNSSMSVLTVYIFLGILNERRQGFETHALTPEPEAAAR